MKINFSDKVVLLREPSGVKNLSVYCEIYFKYELCLDKNQNWSKKFKKDVMLRPVCPDSSSLYKTSKNVK